MQIHELNTFAGTPTDTDFLAVDSGFDTQKISVPNLLLPVKNETDKLKTEKINTPVDSGGNPDNGQDGQLLRTKGDGSTEWVDEGLPTDAQTAQAVSDWLDAHPEATTTVADGSLTDAKFTNDLKLATIKDYVTPQMFGAVGDGSTDDTNAFNSALASGKPVMIPKGTYKITDTLTIPHETIFNGYGSETILKRYTTGASYRDFLLVGAASDIGNFNIEIEQGASAPAFEGSFIKINEVTLASWVAPSAALKTVIHDIYAFCNVTLASNNDVTGLQLSLEGTYGSGRDGFCDVSVKRYSIACKSGSMIEYYCRAYSNNTSYWITGIEFHDCWISNTKWGFFPIRDDQDIFNGNFFSAQFNAYCFGVQMQAQTGVKGFAFLPKGSHKVQMSFVGCRPWDFVNYSTRPWYFDYSRIADKASLETSGLELDNFRGYAQFYGVNSDNTLVTINPPNYGYLMSYVSRNSALNIAGAMLPKLLTIKNGTKATRLCTLSATSGRRTIIFKYYNLGTGLYWGTVCIHWRVGETPILTTDVGTDGVRFAYKITQVGATYTLDIYMYKSGGMYYKCLEALPFDNTSEGFDNDGGLSTTLYTLDFYKYPASDVHFDSVPDGLTTFANYPNSNNLLLSGTDQWGNQAFYKLTIENGALGIVARNYFDF